MFYCFIAKWFLAVYGWWIYAIVGMGTGMITESNGTPASDHFYLYREKKIYFKVFDIL